MFFEAIRNSLGQVDSVVRRPDGASLIFNPQTKTFDEENELTIELRQWEQDNGELDLSDIEPDPLPETIEYRLNYLVPSDRNVPGDRFPEDIDYNTGLVIGLTTETIDYFGLRVAQIFYQSLDPETREAIEPIPIVFERYLYQWDEQTKLPLSRIKQIYFYQSNKQLSEQFKPLPKNFYNTSDRSDIVTRRRSTIVSWLIARATELGLGVPVKEYFSVYKDLTDKYILYGDTQILDTVQSSNDFWLDLDTTTAMGTVRQAILLCFSKALEPTTNEEISGFLSKLPPPINSPAVR